MVSTFPRAIGEKWLASPPVQSVEPIVFSQPPRWPVFLFDLWCPTPIALARAPSRSGRLPTFSERLRAASRVLDNLRSKIYLFQPAAPPRPGSDPDCV